MQRAPTVEGLVAAGEPKFDIVLSLEVVEHVQDPARFLADCAALLAPGGMMVMATLNRTAKAFAFAVVGAEHVLRWLPVGTHDWNKFVTPEEARAALTGALNTLMASVDILLMPVMGTAARVRSGSPLIPEE